MEYEVHLIANIYNPENGDRFTINEARKLVFNSFGELDELMARMRNAIHPEDVNYVPELAQNNEPNFYERIAIEMFDSAGEPLQDGSFSYDIMPGGTVDHLARNPLDYRKQIRLRIRRERNG